MFVKGKMAIEGLSDSESAIGSLEVDSPAGYQGLSQLSTPTMIAKKITPPTRWCLLNRLVGTDLGEQEVKGFPKPVRAYAVNQKAGETIPEPEHSAKAAPVPTR